MKLHWVELSVAVRMLGLALLLQLSALPGNAQVPLGEQVQQDRAKVQQDRQQLQDDENRLRDQQGQGSDYIQQNQAWIQQADQQSAGVQAKLNALESQVKSPITLQKMLATPGNQMYVLQSWLRNEAAQRAQAEQNIQRAGQSGQNSSSILAQDRQQIEADQALVEHDAGMFRAQMDSNADEVRQAQQAAFWRHPNRIFTNYGESAYNSGRYNMGNAFGR